MKAHLKDVAEFRVGYLFRGKVKPDPRGNVRVIQIKDIDAERRVQVADLVSVTIERPEPHLVQAEDVLFLGRGHRLYPALVPPVPVNTIATGYFFILRPRKHLVLPEYLAWSMSQPGFHEALRPYHRGSHIPVISKSDVEEVRIHVPPIDVQGQILELNELLENERRLTVAIQAKRGLLVNAVSRKLMCHTPNTEDQ